MGTNCSASYATKGERLSRIREMQAQVVVGWIRLWITCDFHEEHGGKKKRCQKCEYKLADQMLSVCQTCFISKHLGEYLIFDGLICTRTVRREKSTYIKGVLFC